uniref:Uncharacterized protein n=1 Tax=Timema douglasi TaxID=61478 RepID=A0A7R8ZE04_TIMDO|nr:unnamed protein product [Timema douglasi]
MDALDELLREQTQVPRGWSVSGALAAHFISAAAATCPPGGGDRKTPPGATSSSCLSGGGGDVSVDSTSPPPSDVLLGDKRSVNSIRDRPVRSLPPLRSRGPRVVKAGQRSQPVQTADSSLTHPAGLCLHPRSIPRPNPSCVRVATAGFGTTEHIVLGVATVGFGTTEHIVLGVAAAGFATTEHIVLGLAAAGFGTTEHIVLGVVTAGFGTTEHIVLGVATAGFATTEHIVLGLAAAGSNRDHPLQSVWRQEQRGALWCDHVRGLQGVLQEVPELRRQLPMSPKQELRRRPRQQEPLPVLPPAEMSAARDVQGCLNFLQEPRILRTLATAELRSEVEPATLACKHGSSLLADHWIFEEGGGGEVQSPRAREVP